MNLSENPLSNQQITFLSSQEPRGFNKSQYQGDITNHLDKSIRFLHHIFDETKNLKKFDIYDRINAQTLRIFLENSIKEVEKKKNEKNFCYDFRTEELARLFFELSRSFLEQNPYLKVRNELPLYIAESLQNISDFYYMLSNDALKKESDDNLTTKRKKQLEQNLDEIKKEKNNLITSNKIYLNSEREKQNLQKKASQIDQEWNKKNKQINELTKSANKRAIMEIKSEMTKLKKNEKEINIKIRKFEEKQKKFLKPLDDKQKEISKEISTQYNHLKPFFCEKNRLIEFGLEKNYHLSNMEQSNGI